MVLCVMVQEGVVEWRFLGILSEHPRLDGGETLAADIEE